MPEPILSVVVTNHNEEEFVPEALQNLARSTFADRMELLVIDDKSTHSIEAVLDSFWDVAPRFAAARMVRTRTNVEREASRNLGMDLAHGKFLSIHDGDDFWLDRWERGVRLLSEHPEWIGMASCGQQVAQTRATFFRYTKKFGFAMKPPPWDTLPSPRPGDQWITWIMRLPPAVRYRRVFSHPILHPTMGVGLEDVVFWYERLMHGQVGTDGCNWIYRTRPNSNSCSWFPTRLRYETVLLLAPYLLTPTGLARMEKAVADGGFDLDVIRRWAAMPNAEFGPVDYDTLMDVR
jgi:glycosyltransferase involved in cell wall biosynthesis